jgi:hypothetical protein
MDKFTISLDDFIKYIIKKWIVILVVVVVFVGLFCVSAKMLGEQIIFEPNEKYFVLKDLNSLLLPVLG